jgi:hypothetical protein
MKLILSFLIGVVTATAATLIHQTLAPVGVIVAILESYLAIWWLGRFFGKRRYKCAGLVGWLVVIAKAGSFGAGHELLIQGDNSGSSLLTLGFIAGLVALLQRV